MRKVYLDNLPKYQNNRYYKDNTQIDWENSVGNIVKFEYDDVIGEFKIISCDKSDSKNIKLYVKYKDNEFKINTGSLYKGQIRKILDKPHFDIKYRYDIGEKFQDQKRNLTITDKKIIQRTQVNKRCKTGIGNHYIKWYKYTCNNCGWTEGWDTEGHLKEGRGCSCCAGRTLVESINSLAAKSPDLIKYLKDSNDATKYTYGSSKSVSCKCPICGYEKHTIVNNLSRYGFVCPRCSDNISMPEKFMMSLLDQLNINYIYQLTSSYFNWIGLYRYDFYLLDYNCIVEVHGEQHYKDCHKRNKRARTLKEEQDNDLIKKYLAINNGIDNYVVLDARECNRLNQKEFIKEIISNEFFKKFDFDNVNWERCLEYTKTSFIKMVCDYYNQYELNNKYISTTMLSDKFKLSVPTIYSYLIFGNKYGLCKYDGRIAKSNSSRRSKKGKQVSVYKDGILMNTYISITQLSELSMEHYGIKFWTDKISKFCDSDKLYHGYSIKSINSGE